jgi:hypothetical protein
MHQKLLLITVCKIHQKKKAAPKSRIANLIQATNRFTSSHHKYPELCFLLCAFVLRMQLQFKIFLLQCMIPHLVRLKKHVSSGRNTAVPWSSPAFFPAALLQILQCTVDSRFEQFPSLLMPILFTNVYALDSSIPFWCMSHPAYDFDQRVSDALSEFFWLSSFHVSLPECRCSPGSSLSVSPILPFLLLVSPHGFLPPIPPSKGAASNQIQSKMHHQSPAESKISIAQAERDTATKMHWRDNFVLFLFALSMFFFVKLV